MDGLDSDISSEMCTIFSFHCKAALVSSHMRFFKPEEECFKLKGAQHYPNGSYKYNDMRKVGIEAVVSAITWSDQRVSLYSFRDRETFSDLVALTFV